MKRMLKGLLIMVRPFKPSICCALHLVFGAGYLLDLARHNNINALDALGSGGVARFLNHSCNPVRSHGMVCFNFILMSIMNGAELLLATRFRGTPRSSLSKNGHICISCSSSIHRVD
eukprot:SAG31_NODE_23479_length_503_cov_1.277228_1_plen_116_part_01